MPLPRLWQAILTSMLAISPSVQMVDLCTLVGLIWEGHIPHNFLQGWIAPSDQEMTFQYCRDTSHLKENCVKQNRQLALEKKEMEKKVTSNSITDVAGWPLTQTKFKLHSPSAMDQAVGTKKSGLHINYEEGQIQLIYNTSFSAQNK